jgi:preprotein translocase subunit SecA
VSMDSKWQAIVAEIETLRKLQRAVLVGTPSVDASEGLGAQLAKRGVPHQILNAKQLESEAEIVSQAGQTGKVTIATNMAGRGTDILLDDIVRKNGGLHVLTTEMHSSARIDRQLIGRAARQGDPGSFQFFLSLDDELLRCLPRTLRERWKRRARPNQNGELSRNWFGVFRRTQRFLEKTHHKQRKSLLRQEKYRGEAYAKMGLDPFLELTE